MRKNRFNRASRGKTATTVHELRLVDTALGPETGPFAIPYVALKFYQPGFQCFSEWARDELKAFSELNRKLRQMTWRLVYESGGRAGEKTGLGYTIWPRAVLPPPPELAAISDDITWFELRVTRRARVHGFRGGAAFFLVYLDRLHEVFAS